MAISILAHQAFSHAGGTAIPEQMILIHCQSISIRSESGVHSLLPCLVFCCLAFGFSAATRTTQLLACLALGTLTSNGYLSVHVVTSATPFTLASQHKPASCHTGRALFSLVFLLSSSTSTAPPAPAPPPPPHTPPPACCKEYSLLRTPALPPKRWREGPGPQHRRPHSLARSLTQPTPLPLLTTTPAVTTSTSHPDDGCARALRSIRERVSLRADTRPSPILTDIDFRLESSLSNTATSRSWTRTRWHRTTSASLS